MHLLHGSMCLPSLRLHASPCSLHCHALHYHALHCHALHCHALHCHALHCHALHCDALHCHALHCHALHCDALHYHALHYWHANAVSPHSPLHLHRFSSHCLSSHRLSSPHPPFHPHHRTPTIPSIPPIHPFPITPLVLSLPCSPSIPSSIFFHPIIRPIAMCLRLFHSCNLPLSSVPSLISPHPASSSAPWLASTHLLLLIPLCPGVASPVPCLLPHLNSAHPSPSPLDHRVSTAAAAAALLLIQPPPFDSGPSRVSSISYRTTSYRTTSYRTKASPTGALCAAALPCPLPSPFLTTPLSLTAAA
ncbi:unnamed protein product [Closterium sp. NIES-65]|nr:unnamed protein product [Closterium sp. NIES-65]